MLEAQKFQLAQHDRRRRNGRDGFPATKDDFTLQQPEDIAQVRAQLRARVDDEERLARVEVLKAMVEDGTYTVDCQSLAHTLSGNTSAMRNFLLSPVEDEDENTPEQA